MYFLHICRVVFHSQVPIVIHILFILALALAAFSRHSAKFQYLFVCVLDNVFRIRTCLDKLAYLALLLIGPDPGPVG